MKKEELERIKREYHHLLRLRSEVKETFLKKQELETDPKVKEYLKILGKIDGFKSFTFHGIEEKSDIQLLEEAASKKGISETSGIYVFMGAYKKASNINEEVIDSDFLVAEDDPFADYKLYCDIEMPPITAYKMIPILESKDFEKENIILHPKARSSKNYYKEIRHLFLSTAVKDGQVKALEKIMRKYNEQQRK